MDCDKFEATMLDELYGELDELTLAASKRHATGCARCATMLAGLRATRKLVTLPALLPSEGFESRLLAAVAAAEPRPKLGVAEIVSLAGRWAMRPQTAMAAVFLLIVGTTSIFVSRKAPRAAIDTASSSFTVTENGAPAIAASAAPVASPAPQETAEEAHSASPVAHVLPPAKGDVAFGGLDERAVAKSAGRGGMGSLGDLASVKGARSVDETQNQPQHAAQAFAPPPPPAAPAAAPADKDDEHGAARQQYREGNYAGATQAFDSLAQAGDPSAALWAARSTRDGAGGCAAAVPRFDRVAQTGWGSDTGYDATYEAAECYARLGQVDAARTRYQRLLTVPSYEARARAGIHATSSVAARKAMAKPSAIPLAAPATPRAAPGGSSSP